MVGPGQYPYELFHYAKISGGGKNSSGDAIPEISDWVRLGICRDEVNNKGNYVTVSDGSAYVYDFLICCPVDVPVVPVGSTIQVRQGSSVRVEGTVSRVDPSQFHTRIWL